jgi:predicted chitinase
MEVKSLALSLGIFSYVVWGLPGVNGECWDTGCQLNSWAIVGCAQYGRVETGRKSCPTGNIYTCCSPGGGGGGSGSGISINFGQFSNAVTSNGYPGPSSAQYNAFIRGLPKGQITTTQEAAMALANFLHESDGLRAKREYACANGNNCPGSYRTPGCDAPGQYYFGRGYIQLSWCYNYRPASQDLFGDDRIVRNPDLVATDEQIAWDTAFWFWKVNVQNKPGVSQGRFGETTKAINGGLECGAGGNQAAARKRYAMYGKVRAAFGLQGPGIENGCYN